MNLNYNDAEQKNEYVTKKTFVITTVILSIAEGESNSKEDRPLPICSAIKRGVFRPD